jgi:EAL domain-containing protein (putative c-di-GMP-specific phosphodiesterase class I)
LSDGAPTNAVIVIDDARAAFRRAAPLLVVFGIPSLLIALQWVPGPSVLIAWTLLGFGLAAIVLLGVRLHAPPRPLPWYLFAGLLALLTPTNAAFIVRDAGWLHPGLFNVVVGLLTVASMGLASAAYALLLPRDFWRSNRRMLAVLVAFSAAMVVMLVWRIARLVSQGARISGESVVDGRGMTVTLVSGSIAGAFYIRRCVTQGQWSEAAVCLFPIAMAAAFAPFTFGIDLKTGNFIAFVGAAIGYSSVAAAALHPSMTQVARTTPRAFSRVPLFPVVWLIGFNAFATPLILGASHHRWLVPGYTMLIAFGLVVMWFRSSSGGTFGFGRRAAPDATTQLGHGEGTGRSEAFLADFRTALAASKLELHYQPIVELAGAAGAAGGAVVGVEALLRWQHHEQGWVSPECILQLAAETELTEVLGAWILTQALTDSRRLLGAITSARPFVSINITPPQLEAPTFVALVRQALCASGVAAANLQLEVTEHESFVAMEVAAEHIQQLRGLGVRVALDDFGAGNANLPRLAYLEIDVVKLHRSLLLGFSRDRGQHVLRSTIGMLRDLQIEVCAAGVEDASLVRELTALGVGMGQGHLFGRPTPLPELLQRWGQSAGPGAGWSQAS